VYKWAHLKDKNLTTVEMKETMKHELDEMKINLTIDRKNTSMAIRRRISARDERLSAASVGYAVIAMLTIPAILIFLCDCNRFFQPTIKTQMIKRTTGARSYIFTLPGMYEKHTW
jgi:hypothetical protein